jgi:hypothetical protein
MKSLRGNCAIRRPNGTKLAEKLSKYGVKLLELHLML